MSARRLPLATLVAGGLLAGGVAAAGALGASGALAAGGDPAPAASSSAPTSPNTPGQTPREGRHFHGPGMGLGGRMLHGEVVVAKPGGGTETLLVQEGTISARSSTSITVRSSDGFTVVWSLSSSTTIRTGWHTGSAKDLATGDTVNVVGTKSGSGGAARFVSERPTGAPDGSGKGPGRMRGPQGGPVPSPSATTSGADFGSA